MHAKPKSFYIGKEFATVDIKHCVQTRHKRLNYIDQHSAQIHTFYIHLGELPSHSVQIYVFLPLWDKMPQHKTYAVGAKGNKRLASKDINHADKQREGSSMFNALSYFVLKYNLYFKNKHG